jgi:hypothetical protein
MIGSYAFNWHEGSRSEILADYLFTAWGTVTPVRRQDDHGLDLYCTLADRIDQRAVVREYFVVQVKSNTESWLFDHPESVRWLVEYPSPLFLAVVDKKQITVSVYHVMPRFLVWAYGPLPQRLELKPEDISEGTFCEWDNGGSVSLGAPIIKVTMSDLMNNERMEELRSIFDYWVTRTRKNCDFVRNGLLRFQMPPSYRTNEMPDQSIAELGNAVPEQPLLHRGIATLAESAECIGGQLARSGDRAGALRAALLVDHLQTNYEEAFENRLGWSHRVPGILGSIVCDGLNKATDGSQEPPYKYQGLEVVEEVLDNADIVKRFLQGQ